MAQPVFLKDIWPTQAEVSKPPLHDRFRGDVHHQYATVSDGDQNWQHLKFPAG